MRHDVKMLLTKFNIFVKECQSSQKKYLAGYGGPLIVILKFV